MGLNLKYINFIYKEQFLNDTNFFQNIKLNTLYASVRRRKHIDIRDARNAIKKFIIRNKKFVYITKKTRKQNKSIWYKEEFIPQVY